MASKKENLFLQVVRMTEGSDQKYYRLHNMKPEVTLELLRAKYPSSDWIKVKGNRPSFRQLEKWTFDSVCKATDGCRIEPDGVCQHGHPSWLLALGLI